MKKLFATQIGAALGSCTTLPVPALAHVDGTPHTHFQGAPPDPAQITIHIILVCLVLAMIICFIALIAKKIRN